MGSEIIINDKDLFMFALKNLDNSKVIKVLVEEFSLNVNWRKGNSVLIYEAIKHDCFDTFKYLIEEAHACVNVGLNKNDEDISHLVTIYDLAETFSNKTKFAEIMKKHGAENEKEIIESADFAFGGKNEEEIKHQIQVEKNIFLAVADNTKEVDPKHEKKMSYSEFETIKKENSQVDLSEFEKTVCKFNVVKSA